jgi:hypothetical protein
MVRKFSIQERQLSIILGRRGEGIHHFDIQVLQTLPSIAPPLLPVPRDASARGYLSFPQTERSNDYRRSTLTDSQTVSSRTWPRQYASRRSRAPRDPHTISCGYDHLAL